MTTLTRRVTPRRRPRKDRIEARGDRARGEPPEPHEVGGRLWKRGHCRPAWIGSPSRRELPRWNPVVSGRPRSVAFYYHRAGGAISTTGRSDGPNQRELAFWVATGPYISVRCRSSIVVTRLDTGHDTLRPLRDEGLVEMVALGSHPGARRRQRAGVRRRRQSPQIDHHAEAVDELSSTSSGCRRCSSRKELRTTEVDSIEPPQRHHFQLPGAVREC